jgi:hypothetical protein
MAAGSQVAGHPHSTASVLPRVGVASPGLLPRSLRVVRRPSVWRVIPISIMRQSWKRIRAAEVPIQRDLFLNELAPRWHGTPDAVNHVPKPRGSKACLAKAHASCFAIIKSLVQGAYRGPTRLGTRVTEDSCSAGLDPGRARLHDSVGSVAAGALAQCSVLVCLNS